MCIRDSIDAGQDDKLQTLRRWLDIGVDGRAPLADEKCLIFTQYADTAAYLHAELNPKGLQQIATIYGDDKRKGSIVARFAPRANADQKPAGPEIDVYKRQMCRRCCTISTICTCKRSRSSSRRA